MYTSWRWIYWVLLIFVGVCWLLAFAFLKETYSPVLLARRAKRLRAETGDMSIVTEQELHKRPASDILTEALIRPLRERFSFHQFSSTESWSADLVPLEMLTTEPIMICAPARTDCSQN